MMISSTSVMSTNGVTLMPTMGVRPLRDELTEAMAQILRAMLAAGVDGSGSREPGAWASAASAGPSGASGSTGSSSTAPNSGPSERAYALINLVNDSAFVSISA